MPAIVRTLLGPTLSLNLPIPMPAQPLRSIDNEKAPEVSALVQPNSVSNGSKKTPKLYDNPHITSKMKKLAITTILP
jgi:hypothetical protein